LVIKVDALAHRNKMASVNIKIWLMRVRKWYSSSSKRTQIAVPVASTLADIFLFLHKNTSAAAPKYCHSLSASEELGFKIQISLLHSKSRQKTKHCSYQLGTNQ